MSELKQCGACPGCAEQCRHEQENPPAFTRENRYIVIKRSELSQGVLEDLLVFLVSERVQPVDGMVIESDWPEYEPAWQAIERRMSGAAPAAHALAEGGERAAFESWYAEDVGPSANLRRDMDGLYKDEDADAAIDAELI